MRSLFLAMIPSITVAAEVDEGKDPARNVFNELLERYIETATGWFDIFPDAINNWIVMLPLAGLVLCFWFTKLLYKKGYLRVLDSSFAILLGTLTFGPVLLLCSRVPTHSIVLTIAIILCILALCFVVANLITHGLLWLSITIGAVEAAGYPKRQLNKVTIRCPIVIVRLFNFLFNRNKEKEIAALTLYRAASAFNSMLTKLKKIDSSNSCPEFQLTISGDTELLKKLPYSPPYDILHFIELQSIWAREFNAIQRKIQWGQSERQKEHKKIIENRFNSVSCSNCNESCANELHQELSESFAKWRIDAKYYAQGDNHSSGIMMDEMVKNAIDQWVKRLPNNNKHDNYIVNTRAIRVLFSSEEDLVSSAIKVAKNSTINLPLSKDEIRNVWIPSDNMPDFDYLEDWAKNANDRDWEDKFLRPLLVRSECLNPSQVIETYVKYLKSRYKKESIDDPLKLILKRLDNAAIDKKKKENTFMYLFIGNWMEKKSYLQESPQYHEKSSKRIEASANHLAHLFLVLMALHHKKAFPLMFFLEKVYNDRKSSQDKEKEFDKDPIKFTRKRMTEMQDSIQEKLKEMPQ